MATRLMDMVVHLVLRIIAKVLRFEIEVIGPFMKVHLLISSHYSIFTSNQEHIKLFLSIYLCLYL